LRLRWTDPAEADLHRHWMFHADRNIGYADRVASRLRERADALLVNPSIGRPVQGRPVRELSVPDIQYVIVYEPRETEILIVRIWSTAEDR
jgi:plasmid stabilization system protein ParE